MPSGISIWVNWPRTSAVPPSSSVTYAVTMYCRPRRSYLSITRPRERTRMPGRIGSRKLNSILACSPACTMYLLWRRCRAWLAISVGWATGPPNGDGPENHGWWSSTAKA